MIEIVFEQKFNFESTSNARIIEKRDISSLSRFMLLK